MKPICGFNNNNNNDDESLKTIGECNDSNTAAAMYGIALILSRNIIKSQLNSSGKVNQCKNRFE